jgi:3-oxoacyl-[acyl-carrier protein] reductase
MNYALVTGGSRGIGKCICIELSKQGYPVIINYAANDEAANETKKIIEAQGGIAELLKFDVSNVEEVDTSLDKWSDEHPGDFIEVLINNAGIRNDNLMIFMQNSDWDKVINTNLTGFFYVTRRLLKNMLTNRCGRIINVVSLSGIKGMPGQTNYSAAKAGVIGASKALAQEVGKRNITVNCVAPGFVKTDMIQNINEEDYKKLIPLNRFGNPEEVADLVAFLASKKASYITGEVISINGGLYT